MRTIYKFEAPAPFSTVYHQMPEGARFLKCADREQIGTYMWFLVDPSRPFETREYTALPTGGTVANEHTYLDTYFETSGAVDYVWHIFEVNAPRLG